MFRKLVATVAVAGGLVFTAYVVQGGPLVEQVAFLEDAGISPPNRDAVCPVRLDADFAADAGLGLYQRLRFPVSLRVMADGGRDVQMPPMPLQVVRAALDVVDWNDCTLAASTAPVAALWGTSKPFRLVSNASKPWCRQSIAFGLPCVLLDGGTFGDRNVSLCSTRADPQTCERVSSGVVYMGDSPEDL